MPLRRCLDCPALIARGSRCGPCRARYRSAFSRHALPRAIKDRDGWRCRSCGSPGPLRMHHVIPRSRGGTDDPANLITLCRTCHTLAHRAPGDVA